VAIPDRGNMNGTWMGSWNEVTPKLTGIMGLIVLVVNHQLSGVMFMLR